MKSTFTLLLFLIGNFLISQTPNFVLILADDMGWNGTSVQLSPSEAGSKSDFYETPNLEQLALDGMKFSQAYAPAAKCSPSRCSILNGKTTARNSFTETGNGASGAAGKILVPPTTNSSFPLTDVSIAEWLKSIGLNYRTAHYGKWHLQAGGPASNGFDFGDGATTNNDGNAANGLTIQTDPKKIFDLTTKGMQFMEDAVTDNVPFYLQLSHYAVHSPTETTQASFDYFDSKTPGTIHNNVEYAGMTKDLDDGVGLILDKLNTLGIAGNTYVIFFSDNGAGNGASSNAPLRRGKSFIYEGGIRVPLIIKGPNIPAGTHCAEPVVGFDLYPTIADLTESPVALPSDLDGQNIQPLLLQNSFARNEQLFFHIPHYSGNAAKSPRSSIVEGNHKLIIEYETGIDYLHDLDTDIEEATNIAGANPTIVNDLKIKLRNHLKAASANMPTLNPSHANFLGGMAPDIDNDGLMDDWEFTELLSYSYGLNDDPDGDGDDNITEYNNGTDPLINESVLAVIENIDFRGELIKDESVKLSWLTKEREKIASFEMERYNESIGWQTIGAFDKFQTQFIDQHPNFGFNYYRLKIKNLDSRIDHSLIVKVYFYGYREIKVYPNPSTGKFRLKFLEQPLMPSTLSLVIYNNVGQIVKERQAAKTTQILLNLENLISGIYCLKVFDKNRLIGMEYLTIVK